MFIVFALTWINWTPCQQLGPKSFKPRRVEGTQRGLCSAVEWDRLIGSFPHLKFVFLKILYIKINTFHYNLSLQHKNVNIFNWPSFFWSYGSVIYKSLCSICFFSLFVLPKRNVAVLSGWDDSLRGIWVLRGGCRLHGLTKKEQGILG